LTKKKRGEDRSLPVKMQENTTVKQEITASKIGRTQKGEKERPEYDRCVRKGEGALRNSAGGGGQKRPSPGVEKGKKSREGGAERRKGFRSCGRKGRKGTKLYLHEKTVQLRMRKNQSSLGQHGQKRKKTRL